jgi:hypothetical protein
MQEGSVNGTYVSVGATLMETLKVMLSKAPEMCVCFHRGPVWGKMGGTILSEGLRGKGEISVFIGRVLIQVFERHV